MSHTRKTGIVRFVGSFRVDPAQSRLSEGNRPRAARSHGAPVLLTTRGLRGPLAPHREDASRPRFVVRGLPTEQLAVELLDLACTSTPLTGKSLNPPLEPLPSDPRHPLPHPRMCQHTLTDMSNDVKLVIHGRHLVIRARCSELVGGSGRAGPARSSTRVPCFQI
jgi:hypothetical protein